MTICDRGCQFPFTIGIIKFELFLSVQVWPFSQPGQVLGLHSSGIYCIFEYIPLVSVYISSKLLFHLCCQ